MPDAIVLTPSASGQTGVQSGFSLVTQIARIVGGESEAEIRAQALDALNRVRIEMNQHDWRFMKATDGPITLVDGTATYSLERTFRKPCFAVLINAAGETVFDLKYYDDEIFVHVNPNNSGDGQSQYYMLRNDFQDGLITLYPMPNLSTATDYRLVVEYYARIEEFSDSVDEVNLPEELVNPLVIGGQAYILRERDKASPATMQAFADYQRVKLLLMSDDRRFTDDKTRFRLRERRAAPFGTMYVKF